MVIEKQKKKFKDVEKTETVKEYTKHEAVATFTDGEQKEYTFDAMKTGKNTIVLKDYIPEGGDYKSRATHTIPLANLKDFETVNREKMAIVKKTVEKVEVSDEDGEDDGNSDNDN